MEVSEEGLTEYFSVVLPLLDERQRRLVVGATARLLGRGGPTIVARTAAMSRSTVITGTKEVGLGAAVPTGRVRREGGGRRSNVDKDPNLLDELVAPETRGDPMSPLRWTCKSTYSLSRALAEKGFSASPTLVGQLLHDMGYSLQSTAKQNEGTQHADRDAQFRY